MLDVRHSQSISVLRMSVLWSNARVGYNTHYRPHTTCMCVGVSPLTRNRKCLRVSTHNVLPRLCWLSWVKHLECLVQPTLRTPPALWPGLGARGKVLEIVRAAILHMNTSPHSFLTVAGCSETPQLHASTRERGEGGLACQVAATNPCLRRPAGGSLFLMPECKLTASAVTDPILRGALAPTCAEDLSRQVTNWSFRSSDMAPQRLPRACGWGRGRRWGLGFARVTGFLRVQGLVKRGVLLLLFCAKVHVA